MKLAYWDSDKLPVFVDDSDLASLIKLTEVPSRILKQDYPQAVEIINGEEIEVQGEGGGLRTIAAELLTFHGCVSEALVSAHADSLQVLELDLRSTYDADKIDMLYAVQNVLFNCCNLQRFSFKHMHNEDKDDDQVHILFIEPWACSETLEELHILNIGSQSSTDRVLEDFEVDIGDGSDNTWIWHAEGKMKLTEEIELQITVQIMLMPRLKRLSLNRVQFSRTKRHYIS
ncbi:hypothetical protein BGX27_001957 [Mortierella sp. AM989]|nr:hypothetical protein BGX27_001957 [Mortierella sp. AM989]